RTPFNDVFFEQFAHFLLHGTVATARQGLERLHGLRRDVANRQRRHAVLLRCKHNASIWTCWLTSRWRVVHVGNGSARTPLPTPLVCVSLSARPILSNL